MLIFFCQPCRHFQTIVVIASAGAFPEIPAHKTGVTVLPVLQQVACLMPQPCYIGQKLQAGRTI